MKKLFIVLTVLTVFNSIKSVAQIANQSEQEIAKKWKLGIAMWTFHNFTFEESIVKTDSAGLDYVEIFPFQKSIKELNDTIISKLSPTGIEKLKQFLKSKNIQVGSIYAFGGKTVESWKKEFDMAKQFKLTFITAEPPRELYKSVDSLAGIYGIKVAIHNHWKEMSPASWHPDTLLAAIKNYVNLGACADVGHMPKSGVDPVESIKKLDKHIFALHLKDIGEKNNPKAMDVVVGTGLVNFSEIFKELKRQKFAGYIYIERDADEKPSNLPSVTQEVKYYNEQLGLPTNARTKLLQVATASTKTESNMAAGAQPTVEKYEAYKGTYRLESMEVKVFLKDNDLYFQPGEYPEQKLSVIKGDEYELKDHGVPITFLRTNGVVTGIKVIYDGEKFGTKQ